MHGFIIICELQNISIIYLNLNDKISTKKNPFSLRGERTYKTKNYNRLKTNLE